MGLNGLIANVYSMALQAHEHLQSDIQSHRRMVRYMRFINQLKLYILFQRYISVNYING